MSDPEDEYDDNRDYRAFYNSKYLRAWDLPQGRNVTLVIHHTERHVIKAPGKDDDPRPVVFFVGKNGQPLKKGLVLNSGMGKVVKGLYGKVMRAWREKPITVYATTEAAFGEVFDVVRIRPVVDKPKAKRGAPPPVSEPPMLPPPGYVADAEYEEVANQQEVSR